MLKSSHTAKEDVYFDINDGVHLKKHPLFSQKTNALQIQLFFDEFETANPLGSKKGIHKLGGIYFTLRNFLPRLNSSLITIHLVALFHAQDTITITILEPIVNDLKVLETDGVKVPLFKNALYRSIVQVIGDNLGIHKLFGFVESFSAWNCCRFCLVKRSEFQTVL